MKRNLIIVSAAVLICLVGYISGRSYQRCMVAVASSAASPTPSASSDNAPANFGSVVYRDLANISFVDLYETIRDAPRQSRVEWLRDINQTPESPRKVATLNAFFRALVQCDPQMAADLGINLPRHRGPAMDAMISAAPPSAMPVLADMLLKVPSTARDYQLTDHLAVVIDEWAQVDPEAAAQFLDRHIDAQHFQFQEYADALLKSWAGLDHEAAWKWFQAHSDDLSGFHVDSWLNGWFQGDQDGAIKFVLDHVADDKFVQASTSFAPQLFQRDQNAARKFIEKLPSPKLRKEALNALASEAGSPDYSDDYQPDVVAKFIAEFPVDECPDRFSDVINRWRYRDIPGLLDWISRLPSERQDKVIENFPPPISHDLEPEFLPVLQMPRSDLRTRLLQQMVKGLESESDYNAETLQNLKLSAEQKAELAGFLSETKKP